MKRIYVSLVLLFGLCILTYSIHAKGSLESRQLESMCEKIENYEQECGTSSPSDCNTNNKDVVNDFMSICFFSNTTNSLACLKRINWLYADMFANNQVEPCKTSLSQN